MQPILQRATGSHFLSHLTGALEDAAIVESYASVAFATLDGILLLGPVEGPLASFLERGGQLNWIVGIDAVTTSDALNMLRNLQQAFPGNIHLRAYKSQDGTLFHPKFFMFTKRDSSGIVLLGSNNLTRNGLSRNTELAVRLDLDGAGIAVWKQVYAEISNTPLALQDVSDELLLRVKAWRRAERRIVARQGAVRIGAPELGPTDNRVLIQVVPRAGGRLSQVGISAADMDAFFGLVLGQALTIQLQQVQPNEPAGPLEVRQLVRSDVNKNSRIEVAGLTGIEYPSNKNRPVLIFEEVGDMLFRYLLLMPGNAGYKVIQKHLLTLPRTGNSMPHEIITLGTLLGIWPDYPV